MFKKLQFFFALSLIAHFSFAQAPGDTCAGATPLFPVPNSTVSTGYHIIDGVTYTDTYDGPIGCGVLGFVGLDDFDGVYSFVAPATGDYEFDFANNGTTQKSVSVFADCPLTICVGGDNTGNNRDLTTPLNVTLTGGTTYYVVIDSFLAATFPPSTMPGVTEPQFELLITSPIANDECTGAIPLTVNPDQNCGVTTSGTTVGATASPQADDVTGTPNNDVWYSFYSNEYCSQSISA